MIDEELLAKLDNLENRFLNAQDVNSSELYRLIQSLRGVIQLHKPYDLELESLEGSPSVCHHCNVLYPCASIQTIEKMSVQ